MSRSFLVCVLVAVTAASVPVVVQLANDGAAADPASPGVTVEQSRVRPTSGADASASVVDERAVRQRRAEYLRRGSGQVPWTPGP